MDKLLTPADVARLLECSEDTAIRHMMEMNPINLGSARRRQLRVTEADVVGYLARQRISNTIPMVPAQKPGRKKISARTANPYVDEYNRPYIRKNGKLIPMPTPPAH